MFSLVRRSVSLATSVFNTIFQSFREIFSALFNIQVSYSYECGIFFTYTFMKRFLTSIHLFLKYSNFFLLMNADFTCEILDIISMKHLSSWLIILHRYLKFSTWSIDSLLGCYTYEFDLIFGI